MSERLVFIEAEIERWQNTKEQAAQTLVEAGHKLLELQSERNRILGQRAVRHLYAVPDNVVELHRGTAHTPPDGAA